MIDRLRSSWAAVMAETPSSAADTSRVLPIDGTPVPAYVEVDGVGRPHILIESAGTGPQTAAIGVVIGHRQLALGGETVFRSYVDILLEESSMSDIFDHYVASVLEALSSSEHPATVAVRLLDEWRHFLAPSSRSLTVAGLGPLFAELTVLAEISRVGGDRCDTWRGAGARHDFVSGSTAIEVKSTRAHESRRVTVHGLDQMEPAPAGELYVAFIRLEDAPGSGISVPDRVEELVSAGVARTRAFAALARAGLSAADLSSCEDTRFDVREWVLLPVDDRFPRLLARHLVDGGTPLGVGEVRYVADLDVALPHALTPEGVDALFQRFVGGTPEAA